MMDLNISEIQFQSKYDAYASALWYLCIYHRNQYLALTGLFLLLPQPVNE